jgi:hypothetical protein
MPEYIRWYNMDETGVLLSLLKELKVLVDAYSLRAYHGAGVKRELITVIECIPNDFRALHPFIIWPASTHCANWVTYPTPGWHYGISKTGYTDTGSIFTGLKMFLIRQRKRELLASQDSLTVIPPTCTALPNAHHFPYKIANFNHQ